MLSLSAKIRKDKGKKIDSLRNKGILPAVLYGPEIKSQSIEIDLGKFKKVFKEAGESSLLSLEMADKKYLVLIHDIQRDALTGEFIHVDFYQPILTEEVEVTVPIVFEGEAPAIKELGGTLVKAIQELEVKALPQKLPHEVKVNISGLKNFGDEILVKDLELPEGVTISREQNDIIANIAAPTKVEEELEKPIEEKVEEVEKVEEKEGKVEVEAKPPEEKNEDKK